MGLRYAALDAGDTPALLAYQKLGPHGLRAVPFPDHYFPLLYALGSAQAARAGARPRSSAEVVDDKAAPAAAQVVTPDIGDVRMLAAVDALPDRGGALLVVGAVMVLGLRRRRG